MKAPEKLYFDGKSSACEQPIFSSCNIEYIRKDALLEWAKEKQSVIQKQLKTQNEQVTAESKDVHLFYALGLVIDKINSL